jgi:1-acyl-sn-glycerol-3-phosphate acyltransferase
MPVQYNPEAYSKAGTLRYMFTARVIMGSLFFLRNNVSVYGRKNVPKNQQFVAVSNHLSNFDPPLLSFAVDKPLAYIAKKELYEVKILKDLILMYGAISIDREKPEISTFKAVKEMFKAGWNLGMFIEGTRSRNPGQLGQPHEGPAYFANAYKVPILPIGITGTEKAYQKANVYIGELIQPRKDLEASTWEILEAISKLNGFKMPPRSVKVSPEI